MTEYENRLLHMAYDALQSNQRGAQFNFYDENGEHLDAAVIQQAQNALSFLEEEGYIMPLQSAVGYKAFRITSLGRRYVEGNLPESQPLYTINQGANSINVVGSQNTISNNYNKFLSEIHNANLPDELVELLESLIDDLQDPTIDKPAKIGRLKSFLTNLLSEGLTSSAATILTTMAAGYFGL